MSLSKIVALFVFGILFSTASAQGDATVKSLKNEGAIAYQAKKYTDALAKFEAAVDLSKKAGSEDISIVYQAAMAAYKAKKYDKSITYFNKSLTVDAKKCKSLQYLSSIYGKTKESDKKIAALKKGVDECPKMAGKFKSKLAKAYLKEGADKYNAAAKIQTSVSKLTTTDPKYIAAIAKANAKFKEALVDLEASYAISAKNQSLLKMLSTVYTNLEMKAKAAKIDALIKK